ncbi:MAG: hypothetical protein ACF8SC_13440 [Phycisphaerales bacterium JB037]
MSPTDPTSRPTGPAAPEDASRGQVMRFVKRASVAGAMLSVLIHIAVLIASALIGVDRPAPAAGPKAEEAGFEFAVMTSEEFEQLQEAEFSADALQVPELEVVNPESTELLEATSTSELTGLLDTPRDLGPVIGGGDIGEGQSEGIGGSGDGGASFFGVEATGRRFAYIVDRSASMDSFNKMEITKNALQGSIQNLLESSEYYIVLYNDNAAPLGGARGWTDADARGKRDAAANIARIETGGGTNPSPAFLLVFSLRSKPDAIYFMTDGRFPDAHATEIIALNREHKIPIHCITFVNNEAEPLMRLIADRSGGTYTHVPGPGR